MKKIFGLIISISTLVIFIGCGNEAKTLEYYKNHLEEAKQKVEMCKKLEHSNETQQLDCSNAKEAILTQRTIKAF
ncbi:EexN family lipoprotein [Campylobacter jejuni]|uniref:EexN family lipoprotein n=1 Tax=Campylobacter jejuni TaxID=197 RepID=UPI003B98E911